MPPRSRSINKHHWDNAIAGFEKLTTGSSRARHALAAIVLVPGVVARKAGREPVGRAELQPAVRVLPEDSLADDAALEAARAYRKNVAQAWLDPTYGETAIAQYNTLIGLYPQSPLIPLAQREIDTLRTGSRSRTTTPACTTFGAKRTTRGFIYFKDVLTKYAASPAARDAAVKLVAAYKAIRYRDDASELCAQLAQRYPNDRETRSVCSRRAPSTGSSGGESGLGSRDGWQSAHTAAPPASALTRADRPLPEGSFDPPITAICWPRMTPLRRWRWTGSCSFRRPRNPSRAVKRAPAPRSDSRWSSCWPPTTRGSTSATIEIDRGGLSFTVDTLSALSARWPSAELMWLIGRMYFRRSPNGANRAESWSWRPS